jgi:hypothetical protein
VEAAASDATGVERIELRVNGRQVDAVISQLAQDVPSMTAALQWTPAEAGTYSLDIRAYNPSGLANVLPVATVIVVDLSTPTSEPTPTPSPTITPLPPPPAPTDTPTATPTPIPATATPAPASLVVNAPILNVRSGPSTEYNIVGRLVQGTQAEIVGQSSLGEGLWWQIRLGPGPGALGWVSADPSLTIAVNTGIVPAVSAPSLPVVLPTSALTPTAVPSTAIVRAPAGKALLIVSNRSLTNQPARLTLSGGKSVGGGREFDPPPNGQIEFMLEPDHYRALWSSPAREGGFARGADFTAVPGKVIVMWIVPEEGRTATEVYDELIVGGAAPTPTPPPAATPQPSDGGYTAPPGRALFVVSNRSVANVYAVVTISGGSFAGGQEIKLDATVEKPLELLPGDYRTIWNTPGFTAGREFKVSAGEVIFGWIIPEDQQVFMQFPGQDPIQINN